ncbi:hypothetical protein Goari_013686 [Gossypium aridum]|uniref:RNase H type-1 domain-containing protein n=1 Tax=Gossypium aridum TaxID=34290 RepID=A0A7J8XFK7_GOSAI|nr:hypothetical protein [Gossypium aridum]
MVLCSKIPLHDNIATPFAVEAIACLQAIKMGLDLRISAAEIQGDALSVVRKLQNNKIERPEMINDEMDERESES